MNIAINTVGASLWGERKFSVQYCKIYYFHARCLRNFRGSSRPHRRNRFEQTFCGLCFPISQALSSFLRRLPPARSFHRTPIGRPDLFTIGTSINKLFLSPLIAFAIIMLAGVFTPVTAQVFFIYAAVPSSFAYPFAVDYNCCPHRVAKSILYSSAFGLVTLTCAIRLAQYLFPAGV